jgi:hypothetical protein
MSRKDIFKHILVTALAVSLTACCIVSFLTLVEPGFEFVRTFMMGTLVINIFMIILIIFSLVPLWLHKYKLPWFALSIMLLSILSFACFNPYDLENVSILMSQIKNYRPSDSDTLLLDKIQRQFKCCGLHPDQPGRFQFERFNCHFKTGEVPISCCRIPEETLPEWLVGKLNDTEETLPQAKPETKQKAKPVPEPVGKPVQKPKAPPKPSADSAPTSEAPAKIEPFKCTKTPTSETAYSSGCDKNIQLYYINSGNYFFYVFSTCAPICYGAVLYLYRIPLNEDTDGSDSDNEEDDDESINEKQCLRYPIIKSMGESSR